MKNLKQFRVVTRMAMAAAVATVFAIPSWSQHRNTTITRQTPACVAVTEAVADFARRYHAIRFIEDPGTHQRWLLLQDVSCPAGPALFIERPRKLSRGRFISQEGDSDSPLPVLKPSIPIIHPGDRIIVSEHTTVSEAKLEATALKAAAVGDDLTVRMKVGGRAVRAIATAPGHAALMETTTTTGEERP